MRTLIHISDLHFGRTVPEVTDSLARKIRSIQPNLVVVSGDLTQRARKDQFVQARHFLDSLLVPWLSVVGNHDIPLFNVPSRILDPYKNYRKYIHPDLAPSFVDSEIAVLGLKTTRRIRHSSGTFDSVQTQNVLQRMATLPSNLVRVVVTHHPIHSLKAIELMKGEVGADLFLSGHMHSTQVEPSTQYFLFEHRAALFVEAGTATSNRLRGQSNSFNHIFLEDRKISVTPFKWDSSLQDFIASDSKVFALGEHGWLMEHTG